MSFHTQTHFDSTALLIVKAEIDNTIKNIENGIGNLIEDGALPFGIDDTLLNLEQCVHVLSLVGQPELATLTQLLVQVAQQVIADSQHQRIDLDHVAAMSETTAIIQRYIDFLCMHETRVPQFLLPAINRLQLVLKQPLTREGSLISPFIETLRPHVQFDPIDEPEASEKVHSLYRLALLHFLKSTAKPIDYQAMAICGRYMVERAKTTSGSQYWNLVHFLLSNLKQMQLTQPRLRVLIRLESQLGQLIKSPNDVIVKQEDYADILSMALAHDHAITDDIRQQLDIGDGILSDNQLAFYGRHLFGPNLDTIRTVVGLLNQQINDLSTQIETAQHVKDEQARQQIHDQLYEVANVMDVIKLPDAAQRLHREADFILANQQLSQQENIESIMNSLLFATNALEILERNYTASRLKMKINNHHITLTKVEEAQQSVCEEARLVLQSVSAKVVQTVHEQSLNPLNDIPAQLQEVSGALLFIEGATGQYMLQQAAQVVQHLIEQGSMPTEEQIGLLANAIASADFVFEQHLNRQPLVQSALQVGVQSIDTLSRAVA